MGRKNSRLPSNRKTRLESSNFWKTSKIRTVRDFYDTFESVAWLWRVLGIFPMIVHHRKDKKTYEPSKLYFAYNILLFAIIIIDIIYSMDTIMQEYGTLSFVMKSTIFIRLISDVLLITYRGVWRVIVAKWLSQAINDLSEQNTILNKLHCRLNHDTLTNMIRIYTWSMFLAVTSFAAWDIFISYMISGSIFIKWIIWLIPMIIQTMDLTILGSLVGWLGCRFRSLNEKLSEVVARANTSSPKVLFLYYLVKIVSIHASAMNVLFHQVLVTSNVSAESLRVLSKAHYSMCAIGRRINRAFNFSVIVVVMASFLTVITKLYFIFYEVRQMSETRYERIIWYAMIILNHSIPIIVIVVICNWTSNQAMSSGKLIHEIRVENADSLLYDAVKSFSLQLHHQKLEFTAAGFFPLNSSLLQTMAGTITTHLVILIQFEPKI